MEKLTPPQNHTGPWPPWAPDYMAHSVRDINFNLLKNHGITCIAFDIDATLLAHGGLNLDSATQDFIRRQRKQGNITKIALATNRRKARTGGLARTLGADIIMYAEGLLQFKPRRTYYEKLIQKLGCPANRIAMIGDKLWQDVTGGNRAGLTTILVEPLGPPALFDRLLLSRWRRRYRLKSLLG